MSRNRERGAADSEDSRTSLHSGCTLKRKAVAPGYLRDLLTAKHTLKSMGLKTADSTGSSSSGAASLTRPPRPTSGGNSSSRGPGAAAAGAGQELMYVPPTTLPLLFAQRKKFLQRSKLKGTPQPYRLNVELPVGLLSLPEDVLLKIVCYLHHDEIKPLFLVCKQLAHTLKTAVQFHFNYATPFRHAEEPAPPQQRPERNKKRSATNLAAVLSHLTRSGRLTAEARAASGHTTAPRALFADGAGASRESGSSMRVAALAV